MGTELRDSGLSATYVVWLLELQPGFAPLTIPTELLRACLVVNRLISLMLTSTCLISEDGPRKKRVARIASRNVEAEVGFFPVAHRETSDILGIVLCVNGCGLRGREKTGMCCHPPPTGQAQSLKTLCESKAFLMCRH